MFDPAHRKVFEVRDVTFEEGIPRRTVHVVEEEHPVVGDVIEEIPPEPVGPTAEASGTDIVRGSCHRS